MQVGERVDHITRQVQKVFIQWCINVHNMRSLIVLANPSWSISLAVPLSGPVRFWDMAKYNKLWPITQQILCVDQPLVLAHSWFMPAKYNL